MRLIDADALIENKFKNDISYNAFVSLVKRQPTIDPVKWIPVTERLPEKSGRYLVQYGENSDYMQEILAYYTEEFIANIPKGWHSMDMWESLVDYAVDMIAWMPLPEPWKGEDDDSD